MKRLQMCDRNPLAIVKFAATAAVAVLACLTPNLPAAISVGPSGHTGTLTFDAVPGVTNWSTATIAGGAGDAATLEALDLDVQNLAATNIVTALGSSPTVPPSANALARWNSALNLLQTPPTGVRYSVLMATLRNDTGADQPRLLLTYSLGLNNAIDTTTQEEIPAQRVYYSLTGESNTWVHIPDLDSPTPESSGGLVATLNLGSWANGSLLYVLWVDDNGSADRSNTGTEEGGYTIDNFLATISTIEAPRITQEPVSVSVTQAQTFRLTVGASGPGLQYEWFKDSSPIDRLLNPTATQSTLVITNVTLADDGDYFVSVSNPGGGVSSTTVHVTIIPDTFPPLLISAAGDAGDAQMFILRINEPLCLDFTACGGDADDPFNWRISSADGVDDLGVETVTIEGTNITFRTFFPRTATTTYRITADPDGVGSISDLYGNVMVTPAFIDVSPSILFRQGANGYAGTRDTELRGALPDAPQEGAIGVTVDTDDAAGISHGLLRFENLFGTNPGQVPPGANILTATLIMEHNVANANGNPVNLHRMLVPWDSAVVTYNSFGAGIQADGAEAASSLDAVIDSTGRAVPFSMRVDVTASVKAWASGAPNNGWAMIPTSTDGYRWDTSESTTPPGLAIEFEIIPCAPLSITSEPAATTTVTEGAPLSLSVGVSSPGCLPTFQWSKDGSDIPNAVSATFTVPSATLAQAGTYQVRIANTAPSSANSALATVAVNNDSTRPVLTRAVSTSPTTVVLSFSKALNPASAQSLANYSFNPAVGVISAVLSNGPNGATVTLTTDPRAYPGLYTLRIGNVTDTRASANRLNPDPTDVVLTSYSVAAGYAANWSYATNTQDGQDWKAAGFTPGPEWLTGPAFFGLETSASITNVLPIQPNPIATPLAPNTDAADPNRFLTAYFRREVTLPTLAPNTGFALCHWTDDGAIFYLNGTEIGRYNMPAGPATFLTRSALAIEPSSQCFLFVAPAGTYTLAVEVHQGGATTSSDGLFGAEIRTITLPSPLVASRDEAGHAHVRFTADSNWELNAANTVTGTYAPVAGNPFGSYVIPPAALTNSQFFQLRYRANP